MINFQATNRTISVENPSKGVQSVEIKLVANDVEEGEVHITDLMLQGGSISTVWVYHPSEIRWSHDG